MSALRSKEYDVVTTQESVKADPSTPDEADAIGLLVEPETHRPLDGERLDDLPGRSAATPDFAKA